MSRGGERLQRVEVRAPGAAAGASVWAARCESPEGPAFVLRHDYPDLKPARGWAVLAGGDEYRVERVEGRRLCCAAPRKAPAAGGKT